MENRETSKKYIGRFCPVCKRKIQEGENVTMCPVCSTPHHKDCWEKNGGCAGTYDCPESPQEAQEPKPVKVCTDCGAKSVAVQQSCPECGMPEIVSKQNICKNCGTELQEDHLFCPKCGKDTCVADVVHNKHEEPIRCTQCGTMNHTFDAYCIRCGAYLKAEDSEQKDTEQKTTTYGRYFVPALMVILLIVIVCVFVFSFSSKKGDLSTATLTGYDGHSFEETMERYGEYMADYGTAERATFSSDWQEGWVGADAFNAEVLASKGKAVTYILSLTLFFEDEVETNQFVFWMIHNTKGNTLSVQGGYTNQGGILYPSDKSDTRSFLEEIFDEYN